MSRTKSAKNKRDDHDVRHVKRAAKENGQNDEDGAESESDKDSCELSENAHVKEIIQALEDEDDVEEESSDQVGAGSHDRRTQARWGSCNEAKTLLMQAVATHNPVSAPYGMGVPRWKLVHSALPLGRQGDVQHGGPRPARATRPARASATTSHRARARPTTAAARRARAPAGPGQPGHVGGPAGSPAGEPLGERVIVAAARTTSRWARARLGTGAALRVRSRPRPRPFSSAHRLARHPRPAAVLFQ